MNALIDDLTTCIEDRRRCARRLTDPNDQLDFAAFRGWVDLAEELLNEGADIEHHRGEENAALRPLHRAAGAGATEMVKFLIERGAEIDPVSMYGSTPLGEAFDQRMDDAAVVLLKAGADLEAGRKMRHIHLPIVSIFRTTCA